MQNRSRAFTFAHEVVPSLPKHRGMSRRDAANAFAAAQLNIPHHRNRRACSALGRVLLKPKSTEAKALILLRTVLLGQVRLRPSLKLVAILTLWKVNEKWPKKQKGGDSLSSVFL